MQNQNKTTTTEEDLALYVNSKTPIKSFCRHISLSFQQHGKPNEACNVFLFSQLTFSYSQFSPPGHHIFLLLLLFCFHHLLLLPPVLLLPTQSGQILPVAHLVVRIELFTIRLTVRADLRAILPQEKAWTPHGNFPLP